MFDLVVEQILSGVGRGGDQRQLHDAMRTHGPLRALRPNHPAPGRDHQGWRLWHPLQRLCSDSVFCSRHILFHFARSQIEPDSILCRSFGVLPMPFNMLGDADCLLHPRRFGKVPNAKECALRFAQMIAKYRDKSVPYLELEYIHPVRHCIEAE